MGGPSTGFLGNYEKPFQIFLPFDIPGVATLKESVIYAGHKCCAWAICEVLFTLIRVHLFFYPGVEKGNPTFCGREK